VASTVRLDDPIAAVAVVFTTRVTATGALAVGETWFEGEKLQVTPLGGLTQFSETGALNDPVAVTWRAIGTDESPWGTVTAEGTGMLRL
jgi:hypothetical protein